MRRLPVLAVLLLVMTGCTDAADGPAPVEPTTAAAAVPKPLRVVEFENGLYGPSREIRGCASESDRQDEGYTRPLLIWLRLRTTEPLRLLPPSYAPRSNAIDTVTSYLGPDPGPAAPHAAVSIGDAGEGPTGDRFEYDTHLIGDEGHSPEGLAAAQGSWAGRAPLSRKGIDLEPGDHYLFVEVDPAKGGMDLHGLTAHWKQDGEPGQQHLGSLSLRVHCGG